MKNSFVKDWRSGFSCSDIHIIISCLSTHTLFKTETSCKLSWLRYSQHDNYDDKYSVTRTTERVWRSPATDHEDHWPMVLRRFGVRHGRVHHPSVGLVEGSPTNCGQGEDQYIQTNGQYHQSPRADGAVQWPVSLIGQAAHLFHNQICHLWSKFYSTQYFFCFEMKSIPFTES